MDTNRTATLPSIREVFPEYFPHQPPDAIATSGADAHESDLPAHHTPSNAVNDPKRRYICGICDKRFQRPSSLDVHMRSHTGKKPYLCTYLGCEKRFQTKSNMKRHYRVHDDPKASPEATDGGERVAQTLLELGRGAVLRGGPSTHATVEKIEA